MDLQYHLYSIIGSIPFLLVMLAGGLLCILRGWRNPRACILIGLAIAFSLVAQFVMPIFYTLMSRFLLGGFDPMFVFMIDSFLYSIPKAISWALIFWVIFGPSGFVTKNRMPWEEPPESR